MRQRRGTTLVLLAVLLVLPLPGLVIFPEPAFVVGIYDVEYDDVLTLIDSDAGLTELIPEPAAALTPLRASVSRPTDVITSRLAFALDPVRAPPAS